MKNKKRCDIYHHYKKQGIKICKWQKMCRRKDKRYCEFADNKKIKKKT